MKSLFVGYLAALATLAVLDALWLGVVSRDFYKPRLGQLLLEQPNWSGATLSYLIHAVGIVVFPVRWRYRGFRLSVRRAVWLRRLRRLRSHNLATLRDWPMAVSLVAAYLAMRAAS